MNRAVPTIQAVRVCLASVAVLCAATTMATYTPPQVQSLEDLRRDSLVTPSVSFRGGFPVDLTMDLIFPGDEPALVAQIFLSEFAELYGLDHPAVSLHHTRTDDADDGAQLVRFSQLLNGIPVVEAELVVRVRIDEGVGHVLGSSGAMVQPVRTDVAEPGELEIDLVPAILPETAVDLARAHEESLAAPVTGETRLMVHDPRLLNGEGLPRLVWRVTLLVRGGRQLLVDANNGEILLAYSPADQHDDDPLDSWDLQLDNALGNNAGISCYWFSDTDSIGDEDGITAEYASWPQATIAWWAARDMHVMIHELWDRHSYDDDDAQLEVFLNANVPNASAGSWCGIQFNNNWVAADVLAHEYGHMIVDETSDLNSYYHPGAINESFSDIMGILLDDEDWTLGEEAGAEQGSTPPYTRNIQTPSLVTCGNGGSVPAVNCPDRFSQYINASPNADNGGVHWNANILNKAFFLMMAGGTFNGRQVIPMGRVKAGRLLYSVVTGLPSGAWFQDLRNQAVAMAESFKAQGKHGFIAADVCAVRNAFRAVEIGEGDGDCDGVEDNVDDEDGDGVLDDGDSSGSNLDTPCPDNWIFGCDDNCTDVPNPTQADADGDGEGDLCDDDDDNDGVPDSFDFCPGVPGLPSDSDGDGIRDCLDDDDDDDGILDDGDGSGVVGDSPCASEVTVNCDDNCKNDPNADQYDGNANGMGDACDPDHDGDGAYEEDNCPFEANADQLDTDGDGLGDACDACPGTEDGTGGYHPGYPELGIDPYPNQPDSDGDGIPDACDPLNWGETSIDNAGQPYSDVNPLRPDELARFIAIAGPIGGGQRWRLPFPACDVRMASTERVEIALTGLPESLNGWVEDDSGTPVTRIRPAGDEVDVRGLRFRPRCDRRYFLTLVTEDGFQGEAAFVARAGLVVPIPGQNRWAHTNGLDTTPPVRLPDQDGDGQYDEIDSCPADYEPLDLDGDQDGVGDVCDNCTDVANGAQQPVGIAEVRATDEDAFSWPGTLQYDWIIGDLGGTGIGSFRAGGSGNGSSFAVPEDYRSCERCWYLVKPSCGAGSWGHEGRDGAIPAICGEDSQCGDGESCLDGLCRSAFDLTVDKIGLGDGVVQSTPPGIDCGDDCSEIYGAGTQVELTAIPSGDSIFIRWTGACFGPGSCTVTMDQARAVTANFAPPELLLTVIKTGTGNGSVTSSPAGIDCGADCAQIYETGTTVTLRASASAGSFFLGWGGPCTGQGLCVVAMTSQRTVFASFLRTD